jgi:hypothetical protein
MSIGTGLIIILIPLTAALLIPAIMISRFRRKCDTWVRTSGKVTGNSKRGNYFYPVVRYEREGASINATCPTGYPFEIYDEGDDVTVYYDPARPVSFIIGSFLYNNFLWLILLGTGMLGWIIIIVSRFAV